ncbi:unnamed protein product, partial [Mesorhabditis spiculigera]
MVSWRDGVLAVLMVVALLSATAHSSPSQEAIDRLRFRFNHMPASFYEAPRPEPRKIENMAELQTLLRRYQDWKAKRFI